MIIKITLALVVLVAVNFLLLIISCNRKDKTKKVTKKPVIIKNTLMKEKPIELAPTGS